MAIGSEGEIGVEFRTGSENIHYPWIIDGVHHHLMYGDSKIIYVKGRPDNIYPAGDEWAFITKTGLYLDKGSGVCAPTP